MSEKTKARPAVEKRKKPRRYQGDRRQSIRWGAEDTDRRGGSGRRRQDEAQDSVRSVYKSSVGGETSQRKKR